MFSLNERVAIVTGGAGSLGSAVSKGLAIAGAKVDVPTPWGTIALRIPPGTSSGRRLRAGGMGVRHANGAKGDLIAEVQVVVPDVTDAAIRDQLLEAARAAEAGASDARAHLRW